MTKSEEQFLNALGKRILAKRKQFGLTQKTLAQISGVNEIAISYIESGKRRPSVTTIYRLANAMGIEVYTLFKD